MMSGLRLFLLGIIVPLMTILIWQGSACKKSSANTSPENQITQKKTVRLGIWGGVHVRMKVTDEGAEIEYDCAHGSISEPMKLDSDGHFDVKGSHVREHGGPIRREETPASQPARYVGRISGDRMTLTVTLIDSSEEVGSFDLTQGSEGRLRKCQ